MALCLGLALAVRPGDFLVVGLLPPLLLIAAFALLAVTHPTAIARAGDSVVQTVISGLAAHSGALLVGYAVCLGVLAYRQRVLTRVTPRSGTGRPHHA